MVRSLFAIVVLHQLLVTVIYGQACISYEFHEKAAHRPRLSEALSFACEKKGGRVRNYFSSVIETFGPPVFNVTFHCCMEKKCYSDLDCSFNFNCQRGQCQISNCTLTDTLDVVLREDEECIIKEDCFFPVPDDAHNWSCLKDPHCGVTRNCAKNARFCKRCATGYQERVPQHLSTVSTVSTYETTEATNEIVTKESTSDGDDTDNNSTSSTVTAELARNMTRVTDNVITNATTNALNENETSLSLNATFSTLTTLSPSTNSLINNEIVVDNNTFGANNETWRSTTILFNVDSGNETRNEIN
ncbi:hypothetical protein B4U79_13038 [Dinothrombium tinctorium]|uniref:Uncharacterized protein n=1 Tax=Dinothrombium tinctorium TaxID=1965070 RepID=A0A3S3QGX1_9ACAR|nr:hypothetical protein B4U79_08741 [Dinothrombium tinctorium]RWS08630.1 hypothetical protein B4U79_09441 [Dinothrombium tinctorium]RWS12581.1 hypothetical protein B4U79_13038 [Dinothrombium tinctorium]